MTYLIYNKELDNLIDIIELTDKEKVTFLKHNKEVSLIKPDSDITETFDLDDEQW